MQVSGYIDYGSRLKAEAMEPYFERRKRLLPRPSDLSYYNWETAMSTSNPTPNFQVVACASMHDKKSFHYGTSPCNAFS